MYSDRTLPDVEALSLDDERALWDRFIEGRGVLSRERLISLYSGYAKALAARLYSRRFNDEVGFEEYFQYATVGLIESIDRFSPERGAQFKTYATTRIVGAILNGLEHATEKQQQLAAEKRARAARDRAQSLLEGAGGALDSDDDRFLKQVGNLGMGIALGILLDGSGMVESADASSDYGYFQQAELAQLQQRLREFVGRLPDSERRVISYHYFQGLQFEEIATMLALSKGRISQIHKRALERLHERIDAVQASSRAW